MTIRMQAICYLTAAYTFVEMAFSFIILSAFRSAKDGWIDGDGYILAGMIAVALALAVREARNNKPDTE